MARWAQEAYRISERHAARIVKLAIGTLRYESRKVFDEVLRRRLRELAGTHVRYGYRRLTVLLRREGWHVNAKRIYRLYTEEELIVRTKQRRKMARRQRWPAVTTAVATRPNQRWSMDFVSDKLADGRSFRILTVVDQFTRECVGLEADRSMTGMKVAQALERARHERGHLPESITVDNGSEFCSRALEAWAMGQRSAVVFHSARPAGGERIHREFQWPTARRVFERGVVSSLEDARQKLAKFREHYNHQRPHSALADRTPAAFAELHRRGREKANTSLGRALQSLLIEPLECAKTASTAGERTYTAQNL